MEKLFFYGLAVVAIVIALFLLVVGPVQPAAACYSWQAFTCSEGRPTSTLNHLVDTRRTHDAVVARGITRLRVREVEQHIGSERVFVLGTPEFPYRHWLHAGEK